MDNKKELRKEFSHLRAEIRDKVSKDMDIIAVANEIYESEYPRRIGKYYSAKDFE